MITFAWDDDEVDISAILLNWGGGLFWKIG
jgi:hypothetical protein